jgi:4-aminobutyrate aminotransferase-like enzyme
MSTSSLPAIAPADVHALLARHILADGLDVVLDFEKSQVGGFMAGPRVDEEPEGGLLLLTCGVRSLRFRPPLNLTLAEADTELEIVRKSLKEL